MKIVNNLKLQFRFLNRSCWILMWNCCVLCLSLLCVTSLTLIIRFVFVCGCGGIYLRPERDFLPAPLETVDWRHQRNTGIFVLFFSFLDGLAFSGCLSLQDSRTRQSRRAWGNEQKQKGKKKHKEENGMSNESERQTVRRQATESTFRLPIYYWVLNSSAQRSTYSMQSTRLCIWRRWTKKKNIWICWTGNSSKEWNVRRWLCIARRWCAQVFSIYSNYMQEKRYFFFLLSFYWWCH